MYCTGLGDCFLLALPGRDGETGYVLIDCGVWKGTPGAREWMTQVMEDVKATVGDRGLDVLVATHAHWDHLSGFAQAKEVFEEIPVKEVWLPWTEDEGDPLALRMANERRLATAAAAAAAARLRLAADQASAAGQTAARDQALAAAGRIDQLLKFAGHTPADDGAARAEDEALRAAGLAPAQAEGGGLGLAELAAGPTTDDLMNLVKKRVERPRYLRPGVAPVRAPAFPGVRIYALGPPTDPKLLGKDNPSTAPGQSEVYLGAAWPVPPDGGPAAEGPDDLLLRRELQFPFDGTHRIPADKAADHPEHGDFFRDRYGPAGSDPAAWRRIDLDWLDSAEQLALNLDAHVNNTSLVLAFELGDGDDAPVLLFPGDAQVGNWLSWHLLDGEAGGGAFVRGLLARTVLYKVGHHASHNATLKAKGLRLMTNRARLVAMIPVDQAEAHKPKGRNADGWDMPYGKLLADLLKRTEGRLMRADRGVKLLGGDRPAGWSAAKWKQFQEDTHVEEGEITIGGQKVRRPFYIQYTVRP
jgi:hypothetical protein